MRHPPLYWHVTICGLVICGVLMCLTATEFGPVAPFFIGLGIYLCIFAATTEVLYLVVQAAIRGYAKWENRSRC